MNEFKKQLMAKIGDTTEQKNRVINRVNDVMNLKPKKEKKITWGYYITFASFVTIFVIGLITLPKLLQDDSNLTEEDPAVIDPKDGNYYEELKQFFPSDGTIATYDVVDDNSTTGSIVTTKWISERYVMLIAQGINSQNGKVTIYRITDQQIEIVSDGDSRTDWKVEQLDKLPSLTIILKGPIEVGTEMEGLMITETNASVTTKFGEFTNAVVVEEIEGYEHDIADYNVKKYYAPGYGLVKAEVNADNYSHSELVGISEPSIENDDNRDLLKSYFAPSEDMELYYIGGFENGGVKVQTKWISDDFVRQISTNDGGTVEDVYKITKNEVQLIYSNMLENSQPASFTIGELEQLPVIETVLKAPFNVGDQIGDYKVVYTDGEIGTLLSFFTNVLILERKSEEYLFRQYYAPGFGLVKSASEFYNENTEQFEEGVSTELASFGPIMNEVVGSHIFRVFEEKTYTMNEINLEKNSPSKTKRAILNGRGEDFEGINQLIIENLKDDTFTIFKYRYEGGQKTPKAIEWIDDNRLYVIIGYGYGTVTMGGDLYELNVEDYTITPIFEDPTNKEEIMSIQSNGDGTFTYKKHIYEDGEFDKGHVVEGVLTPSN